jgi:hypothetical protein
VPSQKPLCVPQQICKLLFRQAHERQNRPQFRPQPSAICRPPFLCQQESEAKKWQALKPLETLIVKDHNARRTRVFFINLGWKILKQLLANNCGFDTRRIRRSQGLVISYSGRRPSIKIAILKDCYSFLQPSRVLRPPGLGAGSNRRVTA